MILLLSEIGHLALIISFVWSANSIYCKVKPLTWAKVNFSLVTLAIVILAACFVLDDFSVEYIHRNSYSNLAWYYKICAVWGAHEGSWLLWVWILSLFSLCTITAYASEQQSHYWHKFQQNMAFLFVAFTGFMLFTSNPFIKASGNLPLEGHDLNPLLQDPGMIIHPPMLYLGYVGYIVVFALAIAAINQEKYDSNWQKYAKRVAKLAWIFLTAGITLGSWWAYRELGWGGFWGWDPVENASLLPWLTGTALLHLLSKSSEQRYHNQLILLFAAIAFMLSVLGTFLLRSGLVISVHAFAQDPGRGIVLLSILALIIFACCYLAVKKGDNLNCLPETKASRFQQLVQTNSWLLMIAAATVFLGTIYPLVSQVLWHENLSVGAPYFNKMLNPTVIVGLGLMSIMLQYFYKKNYWAFSVAFLLGGGITWLIFKDLSLVALSFMVVISVLLQTLMLQLKMKKMQSFALAHAGFLIMLIGVIYSSTFSTSNISYINTGENFKLDKYLITLQGVSESKGSNYHGYTAKFLVDDQSLIAEERVYSPREMSMPKVGVLTSWLGSDIYIAFAADKSSWVVRAYHRPLVRWIWFGGMLMCAAGLLEIIYLRRKKCVQL